MTVQVDLPNGLERYVTAEGRLTIEGLKLLTKIVRSLEDHEARLQVLEP